MEFWYIFLDSEQTVEDDIQQIDAKAAPAKHRVQSVSLETPFPRITWLDHAQATKDV